MKIGKKEDLQALREKCAMYESWLRALDEHGKFDLWFKDKDSQYRYVNKHFANTMGRTKAELVERTPEDVFGADRAERVRIMDRKVMNDGLLQRVVPCDESGALEVHEENRFVVNDEQGNPVGLGCLAFETTEKSMAEEALAQAQQMAQLGNWRWSVRDKCLISCSEQFANILGVSFTQAFSTMQNRADKIIHPDDRQLVREVDNRKGEIGFGGYDIEYRILLSDGVERHVREIAEPLMGNDGTPVEYAGTLQDITDKKTTEIELLRARDELELRVEERTADLQHMANHDVLTGTLNRTAFVKQIEVRLAESGDLKAAFIVLDLDGFKNVNDCYGHAAGDLLLQIVAERLKQRMDGRTLVSRLGGDEFGICIISTEIDAAGAKQICEDIERTLAAKIKLGSCEVFVGCSFGIFMIENSTTPIAEAYKSADIALYRAKKSTTQTIMQFEDKMAEEAAYRHKLEQDLRKAVNEGSLGVAFQPQVVVQGEQLVGFEALARWQHPEFGAIRPDLFIQIAEQTGLINELGKQVLDRACLETAKLNRSFDKSFRISVNLSSRQFDDHKLVDYIANACRTHSISPDMLELEVTENLFLNNSDQTKATLDAIRELGARVALDDFGTGYSSLGYLRRFEIDRIKLDRSFIKDVNWSASDQRIVRGIISLAQSLNISTIAEGVETDQQREFLEECACDEIQGFYYGVPSSADVLTDLMSKGGERYAIHHLPDVLAV
ncbi:EAL and GGDEF domain-containing protein [Maritalea porphyrae]|jgi:diguanylate cyclase (GGDEF)-like protein/PAS domain S-box-containing protein|uniref:sensor domain-containing protein n=2 Tax=Maritalea TaxID=623276 RepID=UPI0022B04B4C|nr:EAL domain-containing protein [Maritalea porphyrae]MCZ4271553.1 EAL domain-containing protein [Maritalea porphyrae]